jgi:hypothetical protein
MDREWHGKHFITIYDYNFLRKTLIHVTINKDSYFMMKCT